MRFSRSAVQRPLQVTMLPRALKPCKCERREREIPYGLTEAGAASGKVPLQTTSESGNECEWQRKIWSQSPIILANMESEDANNQKLSADKTIDNKSLPMVKPHPFPRHSSMNSQVGKSMDRLKSGGEKGPLVLMIALWQPAR